MRPAPQPSPTGATRSVPFPVSMPLPAALGATRVGVVVSDTRHKTVTVEITDSVLHPKYTKTVTRQTRLHAHDETNDVNIGDKVRVMETRPLSKDKRWRLVEIMELPDHPFFLAVQFHPELKSRPRRPHPLFREFVRAAVEHQKRQRGQLALQLSLRVPPPPRSGQRRTMRTQSAVAV